LAVPEPHVSSNEVVNMSLLGLRLCPACQRPVNMGELRCQLSRRPAPPRAFIKCPSCHAVLRLKRALAIAVGLLICGVLVFLLLQICEHSPLSPDAKNLAEGVAACLSVLSYPWWTAAFCGLQVEEFPDENQAAAD
jgi:hypothetical protein